MKLELFLQVGALSLLLTLIPSSIIARTAGVTPLPPVDADERAGICYSYYDDPLEVLDQPFIPLAHDAGSRWDRFDFAWPDIEPEDGIWSFGPHADLVSKLQDGGIVNIVGILQMTPQWAASECSPEAQARALAQEAAVSYPPGPGAFSTRFKPQDSWADAWPKTPPRGLYEEWNDWESERDPVNYWGRFVYHTVEHYSAQGVKHWEMWNEPEWSLFWCGSEADYARLLQVGYRATKEACPDCTVLFGGLHYWADPLFFERVLDVLQDQPDASRYNHYFDVMSLHLYSRSSHTYDLVRDIRTRIKSHVPDHPIWLTETGVPLWGDAYAWVPAMPQGNYRATADEAGSYVIQSYANAWAADVDRYFFFRAHDDWCDKNRDGDCHDEGDWGMTEAFGMIRDDLTLRPSYTAYQVATRYLVSPTMTTSWSYRSGARRVTLWGTPQGKVSALWNTTPAHIDFTYPATLPTATLVDQGGTTVTIEAVDGEYVISLAEATASRVSDPTDYFIGGKPYLVIEEDTVPPSRTEVAPLPATTYSTTIRVAWRAHDGQAGIWGFEVQVKREGEGDWTDWLGLSATQGVTSANYAAATRGERVCFRARAWDRAGNLGLWSGGDTCTTLQPPLETRALLPLIAPGN